MVEDSVSLAKAGLDCFVNKSEERLIKTARAGQRKDIGFE